MEVRRDERSSIYIQIPKPAPKDGPKDYLLDRATEQNEYLVEQNEQLSDRARDHLSDRAREGKDHLFDDRAAREGKDHFATYKSSEKKKQWS